MSKPRVYYPTGHLIKSLDFVHDWSEPSNIADSGVTSLYQNAPLFVSLRHDQKGDYTIDGEAYRWLLQDFEPLRDARLTKLNPGGFIKAHIDNGPYFERWQIPIQVSGWFYQADKRIVQHAGTPWRVHQHLPHSVGVGEAEQARIIILIDRDIPSGAPNGEYRILDWHER